MAGTVRVKGLKELQADFKSMSKDVDKDLVKQLKKVADPVKNDAESMAMSRITNMTPRWAGMKIGVTAARDVVWMKPSARGRGGRSRPNFAELLFTRSMDPAVVQNENHIINGIDDYLGNLGSEYGF